MMVRGVAGLLAWAALAVVGCSSTATPTGTVESMDVQVSVRPDGGLDVRETLRVAPSANRVALRRVVESPYADTVTFRTASVDARPVESGASGFVVDPADTRSASRLVARWDLDPAPAAMTLGLDYGVTSAVGVRQPRGRLEWPVLRSDRGFDVGPVTITLQVADGVALYDGTGMAEPGWVVELFPGRVVAQRDRVAATESATLLAVFDVDRSRVRQGEWEWNLDRREQYRFALISAGLFILVVGVGILGQLRVQYPPVRAGASDDARRVSRADRQMLARGLRLSAVVGLVVAAASAIVAYQWLSGLGPALQLIPGSIAFVSVMFLAAAFWYRRGSRV
ncbi:MAG: hypothetical protein IT183_03295 [Acidobacteria bacterium]|nr:hypothetical protein [Acidobacteriota bacterium]